MHACLHKAAGVLPASPQEGLLPRNGQAAPVACQWLWCGYGGLQHARILLRLLGSQSSLMDLINEVLPLLGLLHAGSSVLIA